MKRLLCLLLALALLPALSLAACAEDHQATLDSLHFDIRLLEDGSALFTETRVVTFEGDYEFTRYGVSNVFTGPRVFSQWQVSMDGQPLALLEAPDNDLRPENTFAVEDGDGENTVYIYHRSEAVTRTFQISYRVENAVKRYADAADFHWNLTAETGISSTDLVTATLTVPEGIPQEDFRIWAHGPLNGTFEKQDAATAQLRVEYVPYGTIVDLRTTLPPEFFTGGWAQEGLILDQILAEEKALADSANAAREEKAREDAEFAAEQERYWAQRDAWEAQHPILTAIEGFCTGLYLDFAIYVEEQLPMLTALGSAATLAVTTLLGKLKNRKTNLRRQPARNPRYLRSLPDRRPAPAVDRLVHYYPADGSASTAREISAALLELNLRKLVHFRVLSGDTLLLLSHAPSQLPGYLDILWNFLQEAAGGESQLSLKELKGYVSRNQENAYHFRSAFDQAVGRDFRSQAKLEYRKPQARPVSRLLALIPAAVGLASFGVRMGSDLYDGGDWGASLIVGLIGFGVAAAVIAMYLLGRRLSFRGCTVLTQQAEDDMALWQAFGRFLEDFTTFQRKELPEFPVWREYMVYAVAMGKGQKVAKALAVKYPEYLQSGSQLFEDEYYRMLQEQALWDSLNAVTQEVTAAQPPRALDSGSSGSDWSDNWSDSDGGGGGFSDSGGGSDSGSGGDFAD